MAWGGDWWVTSPPPLLNAQTTIERQRLEHAQKLALSYVPAAQQPAYTANPQYAKDVAYAQTIDPDAYLGAGYMSLEARNARDAQAIADQNASTAKANAYRAQQGLPQDPTVLTFTPQVMGTGKLPPPPHPDASNQAAGPNIGGEEGVLRSTDAPPITQTTSASGAPAPSSMGGLLLLAGGALLLVLILKKK